MGSDRCSGSGSCCKDVPDHKMCRMTQPPNAFDVEKVAQLTSDPGYICSCCGRTANDPDNLCNPTWLKG